MNRGEQLKKTLEVNLKVIGEFAGKAELILVNFIKDSEGQAIHDWVTSLGPQNYFRYFFTDKLPAWHASVAKNTAHLQARAEYLINLDCDNYLDASTIEQMLNFNHGDLSNVIFSGFTGSFKTDKANNPGRMMKKFFLNLIGSQQPVFLRAIRKENGEDHNGTYGHIGLSKKCFLSIGGYNQNLPPMGGQDRDLLWRAYNFLSSPQLLHIPSKILPVPNDKQHSLANVAARSTTWEAMDKQAKAISKTAVLKRQLVANQNTNPGVSVDQFLHTPSNVLAMDQQ
jgi:predicted glycosyltransferase involved in capsule biosynthesis